MGLFDRFRRKGGKGKEEPAPPTPAPTPAPPPTAQAPAEGPKEKKRGLFGRIADKVRRKPKEEAPPEAPAAPPAPPEGPPPPPAPPTPAEGPEGPEEEGPPEKDYSDAPSSMSVSIPGTWKMSKKKWPGVVKGDLSGDEVIQFLRYLDEGEEQKAVEMICDKFDKGSGFASAVDLDGSDWTTPSF
ncbi:hypothetical protein ACWCQP_48830 [Streptomyces chartreusis]